MDRPRGPLWAREEEYGLQERVLGIDVLAVEMMLRRGRGAGAGGGGGVSMETAKVKTCQCPMPRGGPRAPGRWWKAAEPGMRSEPRGDSTQAGRHPAAVAEEREPPHQVDGVHPVSTAWGVVLPERGDPGALLRIPRPAEAMTSCAVSPGTARAPRLPGPAPPVGPLPRFCLIGSELARLSCQARWRCQGSHYRNTNGSRRIHCQ